MHHTTNTSASRPLLALLTDFGRGDSDVGVMKGVIARIVPDVQLLDITHDVAAQNVASAAWLLAGAYPYFPAGTVFVCVVDPGVGSSRRAIALHAGDWFFVGPDNGLFSYVLQEQPVHGVVQLTNPLYHLAQVSSTFHGRDIFAPAGAHLARQAELVFPDLGSALAPADLVTLPAATATRQGNLIEASVVHVDHFGNVITSIPLALVPELFTTQHVRLVFHQSGQTVTRRQRFFAEVAIDDQAFLYPDSSNYLAIAVRNASASHLLAVQLGSSLTLTLVPTDGQSHPA